MRTKTLIIASAALAVGILTSSAQTYSQNIVGYVSTPTGYGWNNVANPLDLSGGNSLTNLLINTVAGGNGGPNAGSGPLDFSLVYVWNGVNYTKYTLDTDFTSGVADAADLNEVTPPPTINPGQMVYFDNPNANVTNVLAGTVHVDTAPTGSQTVGTTTTTLITGLNFVSSKLPIGGGLGTVLGLTNSVSGGNGGPNSGTSALDFSYVYVPNMVNGAFSGYTKYTFDTDFPSGFADGADLVGVTEPQIPIGAGIIVQYENANGAGATYTWTQQY